MKKILFITTGGTISCQNGENGLAPQKNGNSLIDGLSLPCGYDILDLYRIDSTDLSPSHLRKLYGAVTGAMSDYDGVVLLHGTDTLAYTGAFLSLTMGDCKPVVLTGSMLSADEADTDVWENLRFAADTACREDISGVWLAFCGRLINGADVIKRHSCEKDAFRPYSGEKRADTLTVPTGDSFPSVIKLTPFTQPSDFEVSGCGAVVETYGAGGIPERLERSLTALAKRMPVIVTTPCEGGTKLSRYEVGRRALSAGALDVGAISTECAVIYLWLKYGN